jgi:pilus assembly protein CpaB
MPSALRSRVRVALHGARDLSVWSQGPPVRLPGTLDRLAEGWWRLPPRARSAVLALLAVLAAGAVLLRVALSPYGPPVPVLVAARTLEVGATVGTQDVEVARWPRSLTPPGTFHDAAALADGATLVMGVVRGTPLTLLHVDAAGPLAGLPGGAAAVPVPLDLLAGVGPGVRVDLVVTLGDGTGRRLAEDVRVLDGDGRLVWLVVDRALAPDVAAAASRGTLSAVVLPR